MEAEHDTRLLPSAKEEILAQVTNALAPYVLTTLNDMYKEAKAAQKKVFITFQERLKEIPRWNDNVVRQHTQAIEVKHKFLDKLIAALFVTMVKIMSSIRLNSRDRPNIRLKLPSNEAFVHQVYIQTASVFYRNPYLVTESRDARIAAVRDGVQAAVREMLPMDDMLTAYLGRSVDEENTVSPLPDGDDDGETPAPPHTQPPPPPQPPGPVVPSTETEGKGLDDDDDYKIDEGEYKRDDLRGQKDDDDDDDTKSEKSTRSARSEGSERREVSLSDRHEDRHADRHTDHHKKELFPDADDF